MIDGMVSRGVFVVFILPVILSMALASAVMADILEKPDRELNMWPSLSGGHGDQDGSTIDDGDFVSDDVDEIGIAFVGLSESHPVGEPLTVRVSVSDLTLDCGDLYITIYSDYDEGQVISQDAFFGQCFVSSDSELSHGEFFINSRGSYVVEAEMISGVNTISISEVITVE